MQAVEGRLFTFGSDPYKRMPVFITGNSRRCLLWLGGQTDCFFAVNYMQQLAEILKGNDWCVAQVLLGSTFVGNRGTTHVEDAEDLDMCITHLTKDLGIEEVVLFASSTGVQVALEFMANGENSDMITRLILQGVVADPEDSIFSPEGQKVREQLVQELLEADRKEEIAAMRAVYDIPITAARVSKGGYLTVEEAFWIPFVKEDTTLLKEALSATTVPMLVMIAPGPGYHISKEKQSQFQQVMTSCSLGAEIVVNFFTDSSDERRRMLKASEAEHTTAVLFFLEEQERKKIAREEEAKQREAELHRRQRSVLAKSALLPSA